MRFTDRQLFAIWALLFAAAVYSSFASPSLGLPVPGFFAGGKANHANVEPAQRCSHCHLARHKSPLDGPCEDCHTTGTWESAGHTHETRAMDQGPHGSLRCVQCHVKPNEKPKPDCSSCHRTVAHRWEPACSVCHTVSDWRRTTRKAPTSHVRLTKRHKALVCPDCHQLTEKYVPLAVPPLRCEECHKKHTKRFARTGPHERLACRQCHNVSTKRDNLNVVSIKGTECEKCHEPRHEGFPKCGDCHTTKFAGTPYDHSSKWPLSGQHRNLRCMKCHANQQWANVKGTACGACHTRRHTGLVDCARCHTTTGFRNPTFRHSTVFPLKGAHASVACNRCHPGGDVGRVRGKTCAQCHGVKHGGLSACSKCHSAGSFAPARFKHNSAWPKTGVHARTRCSACHPKKQYAKTTGTSCVQCHGVKHGGQRRCNTCHSTYGWSPIKSVAHSPKYPLYGQHRYVDCIACHKSLRFASTPRRCIDCHADLAHGHGHTDCQRCHTPRSWKIVLPHEMKACQ